MRSTHPESSFAAELTRVLTGWTITTVRTWTRP